MKKFLFIFGYKIKMYILHGPYSSKFLNTDYVHYLFF